jgi:HAMP domain-containing protein
MALFGFISFIATSWGTYDCISMLNQKSAALANEMQTERNTALMLEEVRLQQQVRIDVIQIQELLLDYSATRGQDGHTDVPHDVAKYAAKFPQDIGAAKRAADDLGDESLVNALTDVARLFPAYYERGVEMAKVYAADGHSAGNKLMIEFCAQSDEIQKQLDEAGSMLEALERSIASTATLANTRIREARDSQNLIALTGVLVTALTCLAGVFFAYYQVIQPLGWITNCFNRLEKNEFHLNVRESYRSDEIGALGRTYHEFKQRALENRKNSLEAALLTQFDEWLHCCKLLMSFTRLWQNT